MKLNNGDKIAVIGGGPSGTFFSYFIHKFAKERNLNISVTIFDGKNFLLKGPRGCNLCAGIISDSLLSKLDKEGIELPEKKVVNKLDGYILHLGNKEILISCYENKICKIPAVYRGNGPLHSSYEDNISFDDFLLDFVKKKGTKVISSAVKDIRFPESAQNEKINIFYDTKNGIKSCEFDLVAGAFGVNAVFKDKIEKLGIGYSPPKTLSSYQAEFYFGKDDVKKKFGNAIHVYLPRRKNIKFATAIPKGDFVSVTIVCKKDADNNILHEINKVNELKDKMTLGLQHCYCYPKLVITKAKNPYYDRLVMIGDAYTSRLFKNGIESAFITARLAAKTAVFEGIDKKTFQRFYKKQINKEIYQDNLYGKLLFLGGDLILSIPFFSRLHLFLARKKGTKSSKKIRLILWNMFTGNLPYKKIIKIFFS